MTELPPIPEGWNLTMSDLAEEMRQGKRSAIGWPESEWAIEYELSLLPPDIRFPRDGDVYECIDPFETDLLITWRSPVTTSVKYTLPQGCRIRIESQTQGRRLAVGAMPVEYAAIEKASIPWWTRFRPGYGGYHFVVGTGELNERFKLVTPHK